MTVFETRAHQLFPVLSASQIETATRFASGAPKTFAPGEAVFGAGERNVPCWLVLQGSMDVASHDGLDREAPITSHGPGQFSGEVSQIAGRELLAAARAGSKGCTAVEFNAAHVRALMIGSAAIARI